MPVETPGHVLRVYRELIANKTQGTFGELMGWGEDIQRRYESGKKTFTKGDLDLVAAQYGLKESDFWYQRFQYAFVGLSWPPPEDRDQPRPSALSSDTLTVPVDLQGKRGRVLLVLEILAILALVSLGAWRASVGMGYEARAFPLEKRVTVLLQTELGGSPEQQACLDEVYFWAKPHLPVTDYDKKYGKNWSPLDIPVDIRVAYPLGECYARAVLMIDGQVVAWSTLPAFEYTWDTSQTSQGEHSIELRLLYPARRLQPYDTKAISYQLTTGERP